MRSAPACAEQVMPGSERGEASFWLYDFEVPALASMAQGVPVPFDGYTAQLAAFGAEGGSQELLSLYRESYARHPDHPLVQLLTAMGVDFTPGTRITPLEEWLLLDTFVPPNFARAPPRLFDPHNANRFPAGPLPLSAPISSPQPFPVNPKARNTLCCPCPASGL